MKPTFHSSKHLLSEITGVICQQLPCLQQVYHVQTIGLFGSYVRAEATPESDLDVLVTFSKTLDLFTFIELQHYLTDLLGIEVDLVMKDGLKPRLAPYILAEEVPINVSTNPS
jgi:hypothetical protein